MRKFQKHILSTLLLLSCAFINSTAQISHGGFPLPEQLQGSSLRYGISNEWEEMPAFSMDLLEKESSTPKGGIRFAYGFKVDLTPDNSGSITYLPDGTKVWRVRIHSENALSLNLIFDKYHLADGAQLFIYTPDKHQILGAFTSENNHNSGILATAVLDGDSIIVEYIEPKGCSGEISIGKVNHGFKDIRKLPAFGISETCEVDVNCTKDAEERSKRSVALIVIDGETLCSGSLINNTANDGTPYLLSAAHCIAFDNRKTANEMAASSVFYFNYEAPHCFDKIQGSLEMSLSGASVVKIQEKTDLLLLLLDENPPADYNTYYAGWNTSSTTDGKVYTIHHPEGDVKKISKSLGSPTIGTFECCSDNVVFSSNSHWDVSGWEYGITEGGSSGAPLFNQQHQIIGALSGGYEPSGCGITSHDFFYSISKVWNGRTVSTSLSSALDPTKSGNNQIDGLEPHQYPCQRLTNVRNGEKLHISDSEDYPAGTNTYGIREYAEKFNEKGFIYGVHFLLEKGTYDEKDTVWLKIYTGDKQPESLIHKQRVRISDCYYNSRRSSFQEALQNNMMSRDNYLRLDSVVAVDSSFFIAIEVPQKPTYPFSIYITEEKESDQNTAYFKENNNWLPFTSHPQYNRATSLLIEPRIATQITTDLPLIHSEKGQLTIYPNPTTNEVHLLFDESPLSLFIYNMNGIEYCSKRMLKETETIDMSNFPAGTYIIKVVYPQKTAYSKVVKL